MRKVYEMLVAHGAPGEILIDAHPHIGSNLLAEGGDGDAGKYSRARW